MPGTYLVAVTVRDDDNGAGVASRSVVVIRAPTAMVAEPAIARGALAIIRL